jgi:hypothetical protein
VAQHTGISLAARSGQRERLSGGSPIPRASLRLRIRRTNCTRRGHIRFWTWSVWSAGTLQLPHDGSEAKRIDELRRIARDKLPVKYLRGCESRPGSGRWGGCEECLWTMVGLHVTGRWGDYPATPRRVDPPLILRVSLNDAGAIFFREPLPFPIEPPALRRAVSYAPTNQRYGVPATNGVFSIRCGARRPTDIGRVIRKVFVDVGQGSFGDPAVSLAAAALREL